jgi:membrane-associated phospholipid phosphatase
MTTKLKKSMTDRHFFFESFAIFLLILSSNAVIAQDKDTLTLNPNSTFQDTEKTWIVKAIIQDEKALWGSTFQFDKSRLYWLPVVGATVLSFCFDEEIYSGFKSFQSDHQWVSKISPVITYGGDNRTVVSVCALLYLSGVVFKNEKARQTGLMSAEALLNAGIIVNLGKTLTGRQRPSFSNGEDRWNWFPASLKMYKKGHPKSGYDAFPSGHTIAAWSVATVIAQQYRDIKIVPVICYTLATGVGLSRITEDTHWLSDVIFGGALGYCVGSYVVKKRAGTRLSLFPVIGEKSLAVNTTIRF